jgi:four helix bundle protein
LTIAWQFAGESVFLSENWEIIMRASSRAIKILRSSGSACLNFGEAQADVTDKDFINKMSIVVKELKESRNCVKVLLYSKEGDELIRNWILI